MSRCETWMCRPNFGQAGWYTGGPRPGENGPAVIAGHWFRIAPAAFFHLQDVRVGDTVRVTRVDGGVSTFVVTRVMQFEEVGFSDGRSVRSGRATGAAIDHMRRRLRLPASSLPRERGDLRDDAITQ